MSQLEEAGYPAEEKSFRDRRSNTILRLTNRKAFQDYARKRKRVFKEVSVC
jgi:hypothetical protein